MSYEDDARKKLIEEFKNEPFSVIDERGTILNKTHLSSMGYATHVPYSVVGLYDLLKSVNKITHQYELFKDTLLELGLIEYDYTNFKYVIKDTQYTILLDNLNKLKEENEHLKKRIRIRNKRIRNI